jgi:hypothetical protein
MGTIGGNWLVHAMPLSTMRAGSVCHSLISWFALSGLYGTGAVLIKLLSSGVGVVVRCKEYGLLDLPAVAARLQLPPDDYTTHPESGARRA